MTDAQWLLITFLAFGAYSIRFLGLVSGQLIRENPRLKVILSELPGCLIVALIASSLAEAQPLTWTAALIVFIVALLSNNVVITMVFGFVSILTLQFLFN